MNTYKPLKFLFVAALMAFWGCKTDGMQSSAQADNTLSKKEATAGWQLLFDGKSTDQWRGYRKEVFPEAWQIEDGTIALVGKRGGDIITKNQYENFELTLDWKISEGGNSGLMFHVAEGPKLNYTWLTGPEVQIIDDEKHPDAKQGKNNNRQAGTNYDLIPLSTPAVNPVGQFNRMKVIVNKGHVEHWLNGKKVVEYQLWSPEWEAMVKGSKFANMKDYGRMKTGHISLQDHGDKVWFKNIKIRPL